MMLFARGIIPRTLPGDDPSTITPRQLEQMTGGRIPATAPHGGVMTPDQFSAHVGVVGRPQVKPTRINYDLPPHPDTTTAQRLGRMLMMQQSY